MSFDNLPSKSEVMGWDSNHLADFLRRHHLSGCDKVVLKSEINGQRFLNMSDNDLQKFPRIHAPLISKFSREINKKEEKKGFFGFQRSSAPKYQEADVPAEDQGWGSEEFESDDDYESPNSNDEGEGSGGDYESAADGGVDSDNDYEPPPSEPPDDIQHHQICVAKHSNSEYIDRSAVKTQPPVPPARPGPGPGPPLPAMGRPSIVGGFQRNDQSPQRTSKPPPPDRSKKPGSMERTNNKGGNERRVMPQRNAGMDKLLEPPRMPKPPVPTAGGVRRSASSVTPGHTFNRQSPDPRTELFDDGARSSFTFPHTKHARNPSPRPQPHGGPAEGFNQTASLPSRLQDPMMTAMRGSSARNPPQQPMRPSDLDATQDMDPTWYVGQATRSQAEGNLRRVNRDGAFLVRDSSKGSTTQPYTLMVLYQDKVYNIQIRKAQDGYLLGTGLKSSEVFRCVSEIIKQHTQMALLLIDAKNRGTGQQNQCTLLHPAGF